MHYYYFFIAILLSSPDKTPDEIDSMLGVNYVAHYYLARLLQTKHTQSEKLRIINLVCAGMRGGHVPTMDELEGKNKSNYDARGIYRSSKLALHLFTREFAHQYKDKGILAFSVDPGKILNSSIIYNSLTPWGRVTIVSAA